MSDTHWLRCDACNKDLKVETDKAMQLIVRFKPSHFPRLDQIDPREVRHRCRSCGWVNIFIPAENTGLTPNWRDDIVLKRA
jgi:hypothetical protein